MEEVKKKVCVFEKLKWFGIFLGIAMYWFTRGSFGEIAGAVLGAIACVAFFIICDNQSKRLVCEHVADDLHFALEEAGHMECIFEIKTMKIGMVIRVYLIRAAEKAPRCSKAIIDRIASSWYRPEVWVTQIVDLESEEEIKEAQAALNEELIEDIKKMKENEKK